MINLSAVRTLFLWTGAFFSHHGCFDWSRSNTVWVFVYEIIAKQMLEGVVLQCKREVSHDVVDAVT